jgi:hypothetical protein
MTQEEQPPPSVPRPNNPPARARLTVWHCPPPDRPGCLTVELAQRLLDDHTRAGQVIIDLDDDPSLPGVAAATDRGHHALDGHIDPDVVARYTASADLLLLRWPRTAHLVALTGAAHNVGFHLLRHIVAVALTDDIPSPPTSGRVRYPHTELLILHRPRDKDGPTGSRVHEPHGCRTHLSAPTPAPPGSPTDERHRPRTRGGDARPLTYLRIPRVGGCDE